MSGKADVRAVLFDLDGTLLDTAADLAGALNELRREQGLAPLAYTVIRPWVSHGALALVNLAFPEVAPQAFDLLRARFLQLYRGALARQSRPFAGIPELLAALEAHGLAWGVVTNKAAWLTEPLLRELGLYERAAVVVSGDTTAQRKPHPEPLLYAAGRLGLAPAQCLYVGDAERDAQAARAAGMPMLVALFGYIGPWDRPQEWPAAAAVADAQGIARWLGLPAQLPAAARTASPQP